MESGTYKHAHDPDATVIWWDDVANTEREKSRSADIRNAEDFVREGGAAEGLLELMANAALLWSADVEWSTASHTIRLERADTEEPL